MCKFSLCGFVGTSRLLSLLFNKQYPVFSKNQCSTKARTENHSLNFLKYFSNPKIVHVRTKFIFPFYFLLGVFIKRNRSNKLNREK